MCSNAEIARALREMALFLELEGVPFEPRAHEKAASDALGVAVARRGWARRADVINTLPVGECLARLEQARRRGGGAA